jgi:hypothetical protein
MAVFLATGMKTTLTDIVSTAIIQIGMVITQIITNVGREAEVIV